MIFSCLLFKVTSRNKRIKNIHDEIMFFTVGKCNFPPDASAACDKIICSAPPPFFAGLEFRVQAQFSSEKTQRSFKLAIKRRILRRAAFNQEWALARVLKYGPFVAEILTRPPLSLARLLRARPACTPFQFFYARLRTCPGERCARS